MVRWFVPPTCPLTLSLASACLFVRVDSNRSGDISAAELQTALANGM